MPEEVTHHSVNDALDSFIARQQKLQPNAPRVPMDEQWPSACYQKQVDNGASTPWRPVRQSEPTDMFERLGEALEETIHPDLAAYYSRYWSDPLPASCSEGELNLIQVWNDDDMERLRGNLIGHALVKRKRRQPLTLFIATTEPDANYIISLMNNDGTIWLEQPGKKPIRQLAESLADFINQLSPELIQDLE